MIADLKHLLIVISTVEEKDKSETRRLQPTLKAHRGQITMLARSGEEMTVNLDDDDNIEILTGIVGSVETKLNLLEEVVR